MTITSPDVHTPLCFKFEGPYPAEAAELTGHPNAFDAFTAAWEDQQKWVTDVEEAFTEFGRPVFMQSFSTGRAWVAGVKWNREHTGDRDLWCKRGSNGETRPKALSSIKRLPKDKRAEVLPKAEELHLRWDKATSANPMELDTSARLNALGVSATPRFSCHFEMVAHQDLPGVIYARLSVQPDPRFGAVEVMASEYEEFYQRVQELKD